MRGVIKMIDEKFLSLFWPQVPIGLLLLFTGYVNAIWGLHLSHSSHVYLALIHVIPVSQLNRDISIGIIGGGMQTFLGIGMMITGIGLFWKLRSAWAFSTLLLLAMLAVHWVTQQGLKVMFFPALSMLVLIIWHSRFKKISLIGSYLMSFFGLIAVLAYGVLGTLLLGNSFEPKVHDLYTAIYFTVVTLSTVGSNIYPVTVKAKMFMVTLILAGVSIFTTTVVSTLGPLISNKTRPDSLRRNKTEKE